MAARINHRSSRGVPLSKVLDTTLLLVVGSMLTVLTRLGDIPEIAHLSGLAAKRGRSFKLLLLFLARDAIDVLSGLKVGQAPTFVKFLGRVD